MKRSAEHQSAVFDVLVKVHVLQVASKESVTSQELAIVLRSRGYRQTGRSALALLRSFERRGWLRSKSSPPGGVPKFRSTAAGRKALREIEPRVTALLDALSSEALAKSG